MTTHTVAAVANSPTDPLLQTPEAQTAPVPNSPTNPLQTPEALRNYHPQSRDTQELRVRVAKGVLLAPDDKIHRLVESAYEGLIGSSAFVEELAYLTLSRESLRPSLAYETCQSFEEMFTHYRFQGYLHRQLSPLGPSLADLLRSAEYNLSRRTDLLQPSAL